MTSTIITLLCMLTLLTGYFFVSEVQDHNDRLNYIEQRLNEYDGIDEMTESFIFPDTFNQIGA